MSDFQIKFKNIKILIEQFFIDYTNHARAKDIAEMTQVHPSNIFQPTPKNEQDYLNNKEKILKDISTHAVVFAAFPKNLRWNRNILLEVLATNGLCLRFTSKELKNDDAVVYQAVNSDGSALRFCNERFLSNKEIVKVAILNNSGTLSLASPLLKNDIELAYLAMRKNAFTESYFGTDLMDKINQQKQSYKDKNNGQEISTFTVLGDMYKALMALQESEKLSENLEEKPTPRKNKL